MNNHDHKEPCRHVVKFCEKCNVCYCDKCGEEWRKEQATPLDYLKPYRWPNPYRTNPDRAEPYIVTCKHGGSHAA